MNWMKNWIFIIKWIFLYIYWITYTYSYSYYFLQKYSPKISQYSPHLYSPLNLIPNSDYSHKITLILFYFINSIHYIFPFLLLKPNCVFQEFLFFLLNHFPNTINTTIFYTPFNSIYYIVTYTTNSYSLKIHYSIELPLYIYYIHVCLYIYVYPYIYIYPTITTNISKTVLHHLYISSQNIYYY